MLMLAPNYSTSFSGRAFHYLRKLLSCNEHKDGRLNAADFKSYNKVYTKKFKFKSILM